MINWLMSGVGRVTSGIGIFVIIFAIRLGVTGVFIGSASGSPTDGMAAFDLSQQEALAYKACRIDLTHVRIGRGGDFKDFCACFAKRAAGNFNDGYKTKAVTYYRAYARSGIAPTDSSYYFPVESFQGGYSTADEAARAVRRSGNSCAEGAGENGSRRF